MTFLSIYPYPQNFCVKRLVRSHPSLCIPFPHTSCYEACKITFLSVYIFSYNSCYEACEIIFLSVCTLPPVADDTVAVVVLAVEVWTVPKPASWNM
jgi:hypothetical protein